ncbi:hypothetical protein HU200_029933 [Digitaria exilis]|uniref:Uncharacterized protein n=1 Tax=Digitaria exilis TaxID=1010633 RepID=A0A835C3E5_9POAL|nr:hypothetical protein HU200_029933 [Digitaria exilis]
MSGLYSQGFSPARNMSPQIRSNPDVDSQYLAELLAEHQKLGPFMQVLPICNKLLSQEIMRVSSIVHNHGFGDFDRHRFRSPSPMSSPNPRSNLSGNGFSPWSGLQEFNFVGRILGPRGNSLKRVEASTGCRVFIRGKGSIKDPGKDESQDLYKRQQLRELAMLNSTLREDSPHPGSVSPFSNGGMKRAKTGQ